ncbi:MAG: C25 family cysteine peptidase [Caldilineales bacterium]
MFRQFVKIALAVTLVSQMVAWNGTSSAAAQQSDGNGPQIVSSDDRQLVFDLTVPMPDITDVTLEGQTFQRLTLPDFTLSDEPGHPQLPQTGVMVGIPVEGDISVQIVSSEVDRLPGSYRVAPAMEQTARYDDQTGQIDLDAGLQTRFAYDASVYAQDAFLPGDIVTVDDTAFMRDQRVARLMVRPVQYNPATGEVQVVRSLQVAVNFPEHAAAANLAALPADALDPVLSAGLLNYDQARSWRAARAGDQNAPEAAPTAFPGDTLRPWFKTSLRFSGLYKLTRADLQDPSLAPLASAPPARLQVWKDGQQIPAHFIGDNDAIFEDGEALVFYASIAPSVYSDTDVYWFTVGDGAGLRMSTANATPAGGVTDNWLPVSMRFEEDLTFVHDLPFGSNPAYPRWYWSKLNSLFSPSVTVYAALPTVVNTGYNASLTVRMMGATDVTTANPDHHVRVQVNGQAVGDLIWNGKAGYEQQFSVPASLLRSGQNALTFQVINDLPGVAIEESYLDWFKLDFRQQPDANGDRFSFSVDGTGRREFVVRKWTGQDVLAYDVSNPAAPVLLTGVQVTTAESPEPETPNGSPSVEAPTTIYRSYLPLIGGETPVAAGTLQARFGRTINGSTSYALARLSGINRVQPITRDIGSNLRATNNRADYLLIYHADFKEAAQALAAHRRARGLAVAEIDVQDIYDEFNNGRMSPEAIQSFVRQAYQTWQSPAPAYLMLLGDGHYDYRMHTGLSNHPNFIPPFIDCVDPWLCEVAIDNAYVAVSGNDTFPDLAGGRLPASTPAEASLMVNKIISYETAPPAGAWRSGLIFVSDNSRAANGTPDAAGDFEAMNEAAITHIPPQYAIRRVYYDPYPNDDSGEAFRHRTPESTTTAILEEVNAGALFLNYIGHAGNTTWAHEVILRARDVGRNDVALMSNGAKLPISLDMACLSGDFSDPQYTGIEAKMLGWNAGGTVAGWGASGFGVATGHDRLHRGFYDGVFATGLRKLGLATIAGKQQLYASGIAQDLLSTFGLLGDPAMDISVPGS